MCGSYILILNFITTQFGSKIPIEKNKNNFVADTKGSCQWLNHVTMISIRYLNFYSLDKKRLIQTWKLSLYIIHATNYRNVGKLGPDANHNHRIFWGIFLFLLLNLAHSTSKFFASNNNRQLQLHPDASLQSLTFL